MSKHDLAYPNEEVGLYEEGVPTESEYHPGLTKLEWMAGQKEEIPREYHQKARILAKKRLGEKPESFPEWQDHELELELITQALAPVLYAEAVLAECEARNE